MFRARERFLVLVAGRRFGKTVFAVVWLVTEVLRGPPGSVGYYVLPYLKQARDVAWETLKAATRDIRIAKNESTLTITLIGGRIIRLKGADDPERLEGVGLQAAVLDEFAKMKFDAWRKSIRPALSDHNGRALIIGKPRGRNHLKDLYERGRGATKDPDWRSWLFTTKDGGFVSLADIAEAERTLPKRIYRQEYLASFELLAGRVYEEFSREYSPVGHVVPVASLPSAFNRVVIGIDWGFTHPGVAVAIGEAGGGKCFICDEEFHEEFTVDAWETALRRLHTKYPDADWRADPSRPDLIKTFSERVGIRIEAAENDVNDGILEVMKLLHPRENVGPEMVVSDACPHVVEGLDSYLWDTDKEGNPKEKPLKKKDDAADAVRYGSASIRRRFYVGVLNDGLMDR
jgi:hypothetical protein